MNKAALLVLTAILLSSCSFGRTICSVTTSPYYYGVSANNLTGDNKKYLEFSNSRKECRKTHERELLELYNTIKQEPIYIELKEKHIENNIPEAFLLNSFKLDNKANSTNIQQIQNIDRYSPEIKARRASILETIMQSGLGEKYHNLHEEIITPCLLKKYSPEELEGLQNLEFTKLGIPEKSCVVF